MTRDSTVLLRDQRDDTVARFSQFFHKLSFGRLAKGGRNGLVNSFPIPWAFIANVDHLHRFEHGAVRLASKGPLRKGW
jgi:hypothetical protein